MRADHIRSFLERDLNANGGVLSFEGILALSRLDNCVLLESTLSEAGDSRSLLFLHPEEVIRAHRASEVLPALVRAQMFLERGFHVAGYVSYEAAPAFLPVPQRDPQDGPTHMLWFGVYRNPISSRRSSPHVVPFPSSVPLTIGEVHPRISRDEYRRACSSIRRYLESGNTYQVNYTFPVDGRWDASSPALYARLRYNQPVRYAAYLRHGRTSILSFSPELFFDVTDNRITLRPMKGTAPRGKHRDEDEEARSGLDGSAKDRAENRMIVDLMRNDVGRLAHPGSVKVASFFDIERYPTVFQATSTIEARPEGPTSIVDAMRFLFPCGSVTGAPKIETMKIINELERYPRGIYTGAIGYAAPGGSMTFSIAIRTLIADEVSGTFRIDVGSGVTIDSTAESEFEECLQKASFVAREPETFDLFETILWRRRSGFWLLREHLRRMRDSSGYFDRAFDATAAQTRLEGIEADLRRSGGDCRVRLVLAASGEFGVDWKPLESLPAEPLIGFSRRKIRSDDRFQYHKTSRRRIYDAVSEEARSRGWFDAIVLNERNEVAEGARTNIFAERNGVLHTPPRSAGILAGVARAHIMKTRKVVERSMTVDDVLSADAVYISNALRGLVEVTVVHA